LEETVGQRRAANLSTTLYRRQCASPCEQALGQAKAVARAERDGLVLAPAADPLFSTPTGGVDVGDVRAGDGPDQVKQKSVGFM
jgi:hypothetical protein